MAILGPIIEALAFVCQSEKDYEQAQRMLQMVMDMYKAERSNFHVHMVRLQSRLITVSREMGQDAYVQTSSFLALPNYERSLGPSHALFIDACQEVVKCAKSAFTTIRALALLDKCQGILNAKTGYERLPEVVELIAKEYDHIRHYLKALLCLIGRRAWLCGRRAPAGVLNKRLWHSTIWLAPLVVWVAPVKPSLCWNER